MSGLMLLKIFSDCCICFAILGACPVAFEIPLLLPALICGACAAIATFFNDRGWRVLRRLCFVLPFGCLFLANGLGQMLILAVPAVYTAGIILFGELELEYYQYRHFFVRSLWLLVGLYAVSCAWNFLVQIGGETLYDPYTGEAVYVNDTFQPDTGVIIRYALVHLLCGVVLQRQLRLGVGSRAEGGRRQVTMLLGTAGTISVGFLVAEPLMRRGLAALMEQLMSVLMMPFVLGGELLMKLIRSFRTQEDQEELDKFLAYMESIGMGAGDGNGQPPQQNEKPPAPADITWIWVALVCVLLLVAVVLLLYSFRNRGYDGDGSDVQSRVVRVPKKKTVRTFSNRGRVRQLYRDFLQAEKDLGLRLRPNDTSADVLQRIHPRTDAPSAAQLRQVYLSARYDDRQTVTKSQVEEARRALKATHRAKNG